MSTPWRPTAPARLALPSAGRARSALHPAVTAWIVEHRRLIGRGAVRGAQPFGAAPGRNAPAGR